MVTISLTKCLDLAIVFKPCAVAVVAAVSVYVILFVTVTAVICSSITGSVIVVALSSSVAFKTSAVVVIVLVISFAPVTVVVGSSIIDSVVVVALSSSVVTLVPIDSIGTYT